MARLCGRPGCSEVGAVAYGMVPEDLLFWIAPFEDAPVADASVLCRRHADAMVVPRGWTLDDRRESALRLFRPRPVTPARVATPAARRPRPKPATGEQLQIDGTGELPRPVVAQPDDQPTVNGRDGVAGGDLPGDREAAPPWEPDFDHDDDLGGLLEVTSPLLARAFRGTGRPKR